VRQAGKAGSVNIIGFDAGPEQVKALKEGTVQALIAQQPEVIGRHGVQQAIKALKGEATEKEIGTVSPSSRKTMSTLKRARPRRTRPAAEALEAKSGSGRSAAAGRPESAACDHVARPPTVEQRHPSSHGSLTSATMGPTACTTPES
jgi:hypothetical protein